jgi:hypothetical protein
MNTKFERSIKDICMKLVNIEVETRMSPDSKANFFVKEMEIRHKDAWACIVEPASKFV